MLLRFLREVEKPILPAEMKPADPEQLAEETGTVEAYDNQAASWYYRSIVSGSKQEYLQKVRDLC